MHNDASDVTAARAGQMDACARLFDRHASVVLALCRRHCEAADDAMQEAFVRAFARLGQLSDPAGWRPWLYDIARKVCSESRRAARRRTRHEDHAMTLRTVAAVLEAPRIETSPSVALERGEQLDLLTAALDALPEDERLAIHLLYMESDAPAAAAAAMGVSRSGFHKLVNRAKASLARRLKSAMV